MKKKSVCLDAHARLKIIYFFFTENILTQISDFFEFEFALRNQNRSDFFLQDMDPQCTLLVFSSDCPV